VHSTPATSLVAAAALALGCAGPRPAPPGGSAADRDLAEQVADCGLAFARYTALAERSRDGARRAEAKTLYRTVGWYRAAAEGLSSPAIVEARWEETRRQRPLPPDDAAAFAALELELSRCAALRHDHAARLDRAVAAHLQTKRADP
jgi:hypothetical protein